VRWVVANFSDFAGQLGVGLLICISAWEGSPDDLLSLHLSEPFDHYDTVLRNRLLGNSQA
jgi:hypothetical protein